MTLASAVVLAVLGAAALVALTALSHSTERDASPIGPLLWRVHVTPPWGDPHYELCTPTLDDCTVLPDATEVRVACEEPLLVVTRDSEAGVVREELLYDPRSHVLLSRARIDEDTDGDPPTWLCHEDWIFSAYGGNVRARRFSSGVAVVAERSPIGRVAIFDQVDGVIRAVGPRAVSRFDEALGRFERVTPLHADAAVVAGAIVWSLDGGLWVSDGLGQNARLVATPGPGELRVRGLGTHAAVIWHAEVVAEGGTEMAPIEELSAPLGGGTALYLLDLGLVHLGTNAVVASARWPTARTAVFSECPTSAEASCGTFVVSWMDRGIRRPGVLDLAPPAIRWIAPLPADAD